MRVERLVHGGEGLVRVDGKVGFVRDVLPDESATIEITEDKPRRFLARVIEIYERSPHRVIPRCRVFSVCGGCDWQHISYDQQLEIKRGILVEDFSRLGGMNIKPEDVRLERSDPWEYRGRVQMHGDPQGRTGFKTRGSSDIVYVDHCPVARPVINRVLAKKPRVAPSVRVSLVEGEQSVYATQPLDGTVVAGNDSPASRIIAGSRVDFDSGGFFQSNVPLLDRLAAVIGARVRYRRTEVIVDLYAGAGVLAVAAAAALRSSDYEIKGTTSPGPRRVICVESDDRNSRYIRDNIERTGVSREAITVIPKRVEKAVREITLGRSRDRNVTTLIVDPPRGGLTKAVRTWITESKFGHLLYLSCDSASLVRDLSAITEAYRIEAIRLFDFFPQTAHIETLVELALRSDE